MVQVHYVLTGMLIYLVMTFDLPPWVVWVSLVRPQRCERWVLSRCLG